MSGNQGRLIQMIPHQTHRIINEKTNRRLRQNKHDIKLRHPTYAQQRPQPQVPVRFTTNLPDHDPPAVSARASKDTPSTTEQTSPASSHEKEQHKKSRDETARAKPVYLVQTFHDLLHAYWTELWTFHVLLHNVVS